MQLLFLFSCTLNKPEVTMAREKPPEMSSRRNFEYQKGAHCLRGWHQNKISYEVNLWLWSKDQSSDTSVQCSVCVWRVHSLYNNVLSKTNICVLQMKRMCFGTRRKYGWLLMLFFFFFLFTCRLKQQDTRQQYSYNEVQQNGYHYDKEVLCSPVI